MLFVYDYLIGMQGCVQAWLRIAIKKKEDDDKLLKYRYANICFFQRMYERPINVTK